MTYMIVNDLHLGLRRQTGVTKRSLASFNEWQFEQAKEILLSHPERDLILLGDVFAEFAVEYIVLQRIATILMLRLKLGHRKVLVCEGNHDLSKDQTKASAIRMLGWLLSALAPAGAVVYVGDGAVEIEPGVFAVPHLINQEAFEAALTGLPKKSTVLLHANFDNPFAAEKLHSLNLSPAQAGDFDMVLSGHEHVRSHRGNVFMLGSPWPCNIGEAEVDHGYHLWDGPGHEPEFVPTWSSAEHCLAIDWKDLGSEISNTIQFIRVTGEAEAAEAALVIEAIDKFRASSDAFFITNSVKVGTISMEAVEEAEANIEQFDPLKSLFALLPAEMVTRIKSLREEN